MNFSQETAEVFIPDNVPVDQALDRTTHLAIGAHQDDLEIMAASAILECFQRDDHWFTGVVVTDGRGSPRAGLYESYSDEMMRQVRFREQKKAAIVGEYAAQVLLDFSSNQVKAGLNQSIVDDLVALFKATNPQMVFTHNLADKHDTHVGVTMKVIAAIHKLPEKERPEKVFGCEVWRDLDWLVDSDKVSMDVSGHENLQAALVGVFDSQIAGGKRYDLASMGRRRAHATYFESHGVDTATGTSFAMDLSPLINCSDLEVAVFVQEYVARFSQDIEERIRRVSKAG